jgi:nitrate/TMAO reductase-like tetraheme cytochrome c subunit
MIAGAGLQWGSWLDWGVLCTIGIAVAILGGIVVARLRFKDRQTEGNALWLNFLSLGILPLSLFAVGSFTSFEYAKEVQFCGTCHATYITDMQHTESPSLAAAHYQQRSSSGSECYSCHVDYGVHGTFRAKLNGLTDAYKHITHSYTIPIKIRAPFANAFCLKCHEGAKRYVARP